MHVYGVTSASAGTKKGELQLDISHSRLAVSLTWHGPVLDGPLTHMIRASEVLWVIEREGNDSCGACALSMVLPKTKAQYWRSLFEGSEMRSHWEVGQIEAQSWNMGPEVEKCTGHAYWTLRVTQSGCLLYNVHVLGL